MISRLRAANRDGSNLPIVVGVALFSYQGASHGARINVRVGALLVALVLQCGSPVLGQEIADLKKRAEAGDVKAQVQLGIAYAAGNGIAQDGAEAVKWLRKAADQGDASGEYYLGEVYLMGDGVPVDYTEALKWIRKAAEHGEPHAQANLGVIYTKGLAVSKDDAEAARWMRKAADQGSAEGQFALGSMYAHGRGVPQSATEAAAWYRKAADQGDTPAMNNLVILLATSSDPKIRNPKEAVSLGEKTVELEPDNASYLDTLAMAYFEASQPDKAAETEKRALTLKPDNASYKKALEKYQAAKPISETVDPKTGNLHLTIPIVATKPEAVVRQIPTAEQSTCRRFPTVACLHQL